MRRIQLDFIDGLRALLALYIVAHHVVQFLHSVPPVLALFGHGQAVVAMFLTVSGFCVALPQASSGTWTVDTMLFFRRRARRILPPYYAALALATIIGWGYVQLGPFQDAVGEFSLSAVWTHVLLIQNWILRQIYTLDGPMWSIALECQVYLFFPLLILMRRRCGWIGMLLVSAAAAVAILHVLSDIGRLHFLLYFVFGVVAAEAAFGKRRRWLTLGTIAAAFVFYVLIPRPTAPQEEACASLACAGLLAWLSREAGNPIRRALGWKPLAWVGTFSYSIYLLHDLFLSIAWYWIDDRIPGFASRFSAEFVLFWTVIAAAAVAASFGFHVVFERPFMSAKRQRAEQRLAVA